MDEYKAPEWAARRIEEYAKRDRFLALLGSFPNHVYPSPGEVERASYIQTALYGLGLMSQEYMANDGRRYVFAERIPMVHPTHRADVTSIVFGDLNEGESDNFVSPIAPFDRSFEEHTYRQRDLKDRSLTDEQWVSEGYEDGSIGYRRHARLKLGACCKALAKIREVNALDFLMPAVNMDSPKSEMLAKRDSLFDYDPMCSQCGLPVVERHHGGALFVNSRQRWELVHASAGSRCDLDLILAENRRRPAVAA
jgi:hypothetical protein